jgi:nicotinate-nucleotide adenylyltransferase
VTERLGILGGTFDPIHVAHLVAALDARHQLALDRVLLVVARDPWQKRGRVVAPADVRYEMVTAAVAGVDGLEASRLELDRDGPTYTIDTVEALERDARDLVLVAGTDVAAEVQTWHRADELRTRVTLAVVRRAGDPVVTPPGWTTAAVEMPRIDVSSTDVRARVARGAPIDFLVPAGAARVLRARGLYASG